MKEYRIKIRLEMWDDSEGRMVTHDTIEHCFESTVRLDGGCDDYRTIQDGVYGAIDDIEVQNESSEKEGTTMIFRNDPEQTAAFIEECAKRAIAVTGIGLLDIGTEDRDGYLLRMSFRSKKTFEWPDSPIVRETTFTTCISDALSAVRVRFGLPEKAARAPTYEECKAIEAERRYGA